MNFKFFLSVILLIATSNIIFANNNVKNVTASYTYVAYKDMPVAAAEQIAVQAARQQALANFFGRNISALNTTYKGGSDEDFSFSMLSTDSVKGEWLMDTKEPEITMPEFYQDGMYSVTATVWGKAREIRSSRIPIEVRTMCDGVTERHVGNRFKHGSHMYIGFNTPVDGYLVMYLLCEDNNAYKLLPYRDADEGAHRVTHSDDYVFFYNEKDDAAVDECIMEVNGEMEVNYLYVIFSPNPIYCGKDKKATMRDDDLMTPAYMTAADFQKWAFNLRTHDSDAVVQVQTIVIAKK